MATRAVETFDTVADLVAATVTSSIMIVNTLGYSAINDGGAGAYKRGSSIDGSNQSADGQWWEVLPGGGSQRVVNARQFGAKGDATSGSVGTDDTAAIQAAVNFAQRRGFRTVALTEGGTGYAARFRTTDTIHLGYGETFHTVDLVGSERNSFDGAMPGVAILPDKTDRPAINIQGARASRIRGIAIIGKNVTWARAQIPLAGGTLPSSRAAWLDPAITPSVGQPGGITQYAPYAAITVDAWAGGTPADRYPNVTYPTWTGISTQFGKALSSDVEFQDLHISGFGVGIAVHPNDSDGNGDFMRIRDCAIDSSVTAIAICQGQSRNVEIRNLNYVYVHTVLTNTQHGRGIGEIVGPIDNVSGGQSYQLLDIRASSYSGPIIVRNHYCEVLGKLGRFGTNATLVAPITFEGGIYYFGESYGGSNQSPSELLTVDGSTGVTFKDVQFAGIYRFANLVNNNAPATKLTIDHCTFLTCQSYRDGTATFSDALARALGYMGGMVFGGCSAVNGDLVMLAPSSILKPAAVSPWNADTIGIGTSINFPSQSARMPLHGAATEWSDAYSTRQFIRGRRADALVHAPGGLPNDFFKTVITPTNDTISFGMCDRYQTDQASGYGLEPGDILYFSGIGAIYVITAVTPSAPDWTVTATLMNNYTIASGGAVTPTFSVGSYTGYVRIIHTGAMIPRTIFYGDFTAGSTTVANIHRGDTYAGNLTTYVKSGDFLFYPAVTDTWANYKPPYARNTRVKSVTDGAAGGSAVLSLAAQDTGRFPLLPVQIAR